jgi:hypothetical protein
MDLNATPFRNLSLHLALYFLLDNDFKVSQYLVSDNNNYCLMKDVD